MSDHRQIVVVYLVSCLFFLAACLLSPLVADDFQGSSHLMDFELDPIRYSKAASKTMVDALGASIDSGRQVIQYSETGGYLHGLLESLDISTTSQVLVFSKSSAQRDHINPRNPRAIYFNDDVYVGYIPGAPSLELTASDPRLGTVFYTLDQRRSDKPEFKRTSQCLECHAASRTMGVPGHLFRSFSVDQSGWVGFTELGDQMNHRLPFVDRYGGWYLSGQKVPDVTHGQRLLNLDAAGVAPFPFHTGDYPESRSDIVALMVLGHQVHFHNYLTRLNYEARIAMRQYGHVRYLKQQIEGFLRYLLFVEEAPLPDIITGHKGFVESFLKRAKKDDQGRSLRDFDLTNRLFRYRCSYLIGSTAFNGLEATVRREISLRLKTILESSDLKAPYAVLPKSERETIRHILVSTERSITSFW
jgi:hypothetical protein